MMDSMHIILAPFPSLIGVEILAVFAAIAVLYAFSKRARGAWGRAVVLALVLAALANPSIVTEQRQPLKDIALLVVDESASMQIGERKAQVDRALDVLSQKLADFKDLETEILYVKGREETDLFHAIDQKLATLPRDRLAGIIALTDGEVHDKPQADLPTPLHALLAGQHDEIDRRLIIKQAPAYGIVGKKVTITVRIDDQPKPLGSLAVVSLRRDNGDIQTVTMPIGKDVPFDVTIDHAGENLIAFSTDTLPHELTSLNNTAVVSVNGIRDRLRVLLVSGQPHIGGRTWRNFLKADPAVDLIHFTILRSPAKMDNTPNNELALIAFPVRELFEVKLKSFDLVILDRFHNQSLVPDEYLENIARYVEDGGALLVSNATDEIDSSLSASPLSRVLPVVPTGELLTGRFVPDLTQVGQRHPVTSPLVVDMPHDQWGPWFRQIAGHATKGDVLMSGYNNQPLLVLDHVGKGRVAQFLSDQFWLWSRQGSGPQAEMLRRVAHWLVQEPELDETALHAHSESTDAGWNLVISKRSLHDTSDDVTVIDPKGQIIQSHLVVGSVPGVLTSTIPVTQTGLYRLKADDKEILTMVGTTDALEFKDMLATEDILEPFVKDSGGGIEWLADQVPNIHRVAAGSAAKGWNWIGLRQNGQYRIIGSRDYPLLPPWLLVISILVVAFWVWRREGKS